MVVVAVAVVHTSATQRASARGVSYLAKETRVLEMDGWVSSVARPSGWQPAKQPASPRTWLQPRTGDNSWRGALLLIWSLLLAGQSSIAPPPPLPPPSHPLGSSSRAGEERGDCHHTKWVGFTHGPRLKGPEAEQRREPEGRRGSAFTNTRTLASRSSGEEATHRVCISQAQHETAAGRCCWSWSLVSLWPSNKRMREGARSAQTAERPVLSTTVRQDFRFLGRSW